MRRNSGRARSLAGLLALLVGLTFAAPPAFAADPVPEPTPAPPTLVETAEATIEALPAATLASAVQAPPEPMSAPGNSSFFKTGKGAAVLVLLAGGLGYTIYSFSHDRVKSPQK